MSRGFDLAIFYFDKTLVGLDSFGISGDLASLSGLERLRLFFYAVACRIGLIDNTRYKELVLDRIWRGRSIPERDVQRENLMFALKALAVEPAMSRLREHLAKGDRVAIFSASPIWYLEPFVEGISREIAVFGSTVKKWHGHYRVENLFRERKAEKAEEFISANPADSIWVYTDHIDDLELMRLGDRVVLVNPMPATRSAVEQAGIKFEVMEVKEVIDE
jgi:phosphoserine phosphatase